MKKFRKLLAIILSLGILATLCAVPMVTASADGQTPLKFGSDHKFKIVIFSDVQDQFPVHQRVLNIMRQAITREEPDLVVFLGDNTEQNIVDPNVDLRRTLNQILAPVVEANVPYAFVFGNHDDQVSPSGGYTRPAVKDSMLTVYQSIGDCRTYDAVPSMYGTGTCKIPIYSSNGNDVAFDLFMMDSNAYQDPADTHSGYGSPHADQLAWLAANEDEGVNSLLFQHIPMPEIYNLLVEDANGEKTYGSTKYAKSLNANATGVINEYPNPCPYENNTGEFTTIKNMGSVLGVFTGHDHLNDFTGTYQGVDMTAVPGMTYFNYGNEAVRGYGVIELDETDLTDYDYHSVKFSTLDQEAGTSGTVTYDEHDTITYADLRKNGEALPPTEYNITGSNNFTYTVTSPSNSAKFRFRYIVGNDTGIQFSFDQGEGGNVSYPFGVWVKKPNQGSAGANGAWHLRPDKGNSTMVNMDSPLTVGQTYDIELGRLMITGGDLQHLGMYYVYLKVNGQTVCETYTNVDELGRYISGSALCQVSNIIRFGDWAGVDNNNKIAPYSGERYEPYDVITYSDLYKNETKTTPLDAGSYTFGESSNNVFYYNATSATHSAIYKLRWKVGSTNYFQLYPGVYCTDPFQYRVNLNTSPQTWQKRYAPGDTATNIPYTINEGDVFDLEIARLQVADGVNEGKYYTYFKVNDNIIFEQYVDPSGVDEKAFRDSIQLNLAANGDSATIMPIPGNADDTYYDYDVITYYDLIKGNGNKITSSTTTLSGGISYTYDVTSPTYSAILKFRHTCGSTAALTFSFDNNSNNICYPFGVWLKKPNSDGAGENGAWHLKANVGSSTLVNLDAPYAKNDYQDIELGRLKVKNGNPDVIGKYYVYLKVNGVLIKDGYSEVDANGFYTSGSNTACRLSNEIFFGCWGNGGNALMSASQNVGEEYAPYDEIYYGALYENGNPVNSTERTGGGATYTYNKTSETGSAVMKFRWKNANPNSSFAMSFDTRGTQDSYNYKFGVQLYKATDDATNYPKGYVWLNIGDGPKASLPAAIVSGNNYDFELGRLKVISGPNTGRYFLYFKINGEMIACDYIASNVVDSEGNYSSAPGPVACSLSNKLYISFWGSGAQQTITNSPYTETYEDYDEVYYSDLLVNGNAVPESKSGSGTAYTYNKTSPSGSAVLKLRYSLGDGAATEGQISFDLRGSDNAINYMFGVQIYKPTTEYPNGRIWLRPGYNNATSIPFEQAPVTGQNYDIEFGRLKVASGPNKGKYYVYYMMDGVLLAADYVGANVVDGNGNYTSTPGSVACTISNKIYITFWGGGGATITNPSFAETYEEYDEIGYSDLFCEGSPLSADGKSISGATVFNYDRTSETGSAILKYRWDVGTAAKFQLSFDKTSSSAMTYRFGAWLSEPDQTYSNGNMWLIPGYTADSTKVNLPTALTPGESYNVEFARLKVASGPNRGKYYLYIKIGDVMIKSGYVAADIVDDQGNYTSNPGPASCNVKSGEIFIAVWGSEGNKLRAYKAPPVAGHDGIKCDFDANGAYNAADITGLINFLIGKDGYNELPEGMGDFNNDGSDNILDLVVMKKHFARGNSYSKTASLVVGTQEHLLEDDSKSAAYIADATATLGAGAYRLSTPIHTLYYATAENGVTERTDNLNQVKALVAALKAQGVTTILYVTDSYILPAGYSNTSVNHNKTVPNPSTEHETYQDWLKVNSNAFAALAEAIPEIDFFEPFNEVNLTDTRLEKPGIPWGATSQQQKNYKYTVAEKAGIMADLCWNVSKAVKSVDSANQVTTPSISVGSNSIIEGNFLDALYAQIESGVYPSNQTLGDIRVDNFFTIVNLHTYPSYASSYTSHINTMASNLNTQYTYMQSHHDGDSRVWLTETGVSTYGSRNATTCGNILNAALTKVNTSCTYIDTVFTYKIGDISTDLEAGDAETYYGLFKSGDDLDDPYAVKETAKAVYRFTHGGSTDYSALNSLVSRWAS